MLDYLTHQAPVQARTRNQHEVTPVRTQSVGEGQEMKKHSVIGDHNDSRCGCCLAPGLLGRAARSPRLDQQMQGNNRKRQQYSAYEIEAHAPEPAGKQLAACSCAVSRAAIDVDGGIGHDRHYAIFKMRLPESVASLEIEYRTRRLHPNKLKTRLRLATEQCGRPIDGNRTA